MKSGVKVKLARTLSSNSKVNKKAIQMRQSWDEVEALLKNLNKQQKK